MCTINIEILIWKFEPSLVLFAILEILFIDSQNTV